MQLKHRITRDESAVSPVIGVILMVAITVILAAVIASFVLGLGPNTATTPQATFSLENLDTDDDGTFDRVKISMSSGDTLNASDLSVNGEGVASESLGDAAGGTLSSNSEITSGTSFEIDVSQEDYVINLVYESGDTTSTMQTFEG